MFDEFRRCFDMFQQSGIDAPLIESLRLFDLMSHGTLRNTDLSALEKGGTDLASLIRERKRGVPLEYIVGKAVFMGRLFHCSPATLIPPEETAFLVRVASQFIRERQKRSPSPTVIEIGTGSGNVAISIALELDDVTILASDVSPEAIEVACRNVEKFALQEYVRLFCGDVLAPFRELGCTGKTSVVVCAPPFIPTGSLKKLPPEIVDYEPIVALDGGPYGISFFKRLIDESAQMLEPGGVLVFEIGVGQHKLVQRLLKRAGSYREIQCHEDDEGIRVISAVKTEVDA